MNDPKLQQDIFKIGIMSILGLIGGGIRMCNEDFIKEWRRVVGSLMLSSAAGGLTAAVLYNHVTDQIYLGAICSMAGYCGQVTLYLLSEIVRKRAYIKVQISRDLEDAADDLKTATARDKEDEFDSIETIQKKQAGRDKEDIKTKAEKKVARDKEDIKEKWLKK